MMKKLYLLILLCVPLKSVAGIDPGRVAAIELASDQAKKTIESQEKAQLRRKPLSRRRRRSC